ncbi:MAG: hypothetical protein ACT4NU_08295 [Chromatiales bacterium]
MRTFVTSVHFFRNAHEGQEWLRTHPHGFLLPLEQAHLAAKLKNRYEYGSLEAGQADGLQELQAG